MFSGAILRDNGLIFCACWLCCAAARPECRTTFGSGRRGVPPFAFRHLRRFWEPNFVQPWYLNLSYTQLYSLFINEAGFSFGLISLLLCSAVLVKCRSPHAGIPTDRTIRQVPRFCTSRCLSVSLWVGRRPGCAAPRPERAVPRAAPQTAVYPYDDATHITHSTSHLQFTAHEQAGDRGPWTMRACDRCQRMAALIREPDPMQ